MARVTVEDCLKNVENRFDLVIKAARRAHDIEMGTVKPMVDEDDDKPTVIALREIAAGYDVTKVQYVEEEVVLKPIEELRAAAAVEEDDDEE